MADLVFEDELSTDQEAKTFIALSKRLLDIESDGESVYVDAVIECSSSKDKINGASSLRLDIFLEG